MCEIQIISYQSTTKHSLSLCWLSVWTFSCKQSLFFVWNFQFFFYNFFVLFVCLFVYDSHHSILEKWDSENSWLSAHTCENFEICFEKEKKNKIFLKKGGKKLTRIQNKLWISKWLTDYRYGLLLLVFKTIKPKKKKKKQFKNKREFIAIVATTLLFV